MNTDLLNIVKQIVATRGESIFSEPKIISAFFSDLARDVPKPQKNALIKCLEHNFAQTLRNVDKAERANCKQKLAEKLNEEEGLEIILCTNAVELLAAVILGKENPPTKVIIPSDTFTDPRDGKVYRTVKIGEQVWMAENLAYNAPDSKCYNNDESNGSKYGRLYNWNTAMKACPPDWHLPSKDEWQTLVDFAGGDKIAGKKLKAKNGWNGTDDFDFFALPGGCGNSDGSFSNIDYYGYWWVATDIGTDDAYDRCLYYYNERVYEDECNKDRLFNVRCIKD